jgi:IK cytokine
MNRSAANPDYQSIDAEADEYKALTAEQTKYLGGDIDHTHLVKGLDFALLSKMRDEQDRKEDTKLSR